MAGTAAGSSSPATPPAPDKPKPKGRPGKYGKKIKVATLLKNTDRLQEAPSPVYGEEDVVRAEPFDAIELSLADWWPAPATPAP